jgi:hypothetical protein
VTAVPVPPSGVTARTSPLPGCVGEWVVPSGDPHRGLRILLFDTPTGRRLEVAGEVAPVRPSGEARHARAWCWALLRAADWAAQGPQPEPAPEPQLSLYDLLEGAPA